MEDDELEKLADALHELWGGNIRFEGEPVMVPPDVFFECGRAVACYRHLKEGVMSFKQLLERVK